jgi:hypothetical protein
VGDFAGLMICLVAINCAAMSSGFGGAGQEFRVALLLDLIFERFKIPAIQSKNCL